jgi:hypothetical protein
MVYINLLKQQVLKDKDKITNSRIKMSNILTSSALKKIKSLRTPWKVQEFVDTFEYNSDKRICVADVLRDKKADCLEAACFALFVLRTNKFESFLMDLSAFRDEDHVVCVFKVNGLYGSIAQSKFVNLRYRHPVYRNLRELAISYFDNYFNYQGFFGLRSFSKMPLDDLNDDWIFDDKKIINIENGFSKIAHEALVPKDIKLTPASKLKFQREIVIIPKYAKVGKKYK